MTIYIDHRERRCKVPQLLNNRGIETKIISSQITDYIIDKDCGVERKTINDFLLSIIDKRIFRQTNDLCQNFYNPLVILEGGGLYRNNLKVNHNVIRGTMIWIGVNKRVPIIRTFNQEDTAEILFLLAKNRQEKSKKYFSLDYKKRSKTWQQQELNILQAIDGVGYSLAKTLLRKFDSINTIITATEEELRTVTGIGSEKAKYIKKLFSNL